jgi:hypothetical protein
MRKWAVCAVLVFVCASANAQSVNFDALAKIKGVEYTHVSKDMIKLAAQQGKGLHVGEAVSLGDGEGEEFLNQFDDVKVFTCEQKGSIKKFKNTALNLLKGRQWEPLLETTGDEGEIVKIYLSKNGERSTNVVLALSDEEAHLVVINGTFDFAKMMQEGMKVKTEVNDTKVEINNCTKSIER